MRFHPLLWNTLRGGHDRFNRELARFGDIPRAAVVIEDAASADGFVETMRPKRYDEDLATYRARVEDFEAHCKSFFLVVRAIQWSGRVPIIWAGNRERAANYVQWALSEVVEDFDPERLAVCEATAIAAGPYASLADLRKATLLSVFGLCSVCARRPGPRPKVAGPGICACGRKERAA